MKFDSNKINAAIDTYNEIMEMVNTASFCSAEFRKIFNGFYRLRQKPADWYDTYYSIFQECKNNAMSFKEVLTKMFDETGEIHPSFCSKLIATLNPNKPIWDQYVLQWLGIMLNNPKDKKERIDYYAKIYEQIEIEYNAHLYDKNIVATLVDFDKLVPHGINLTKIKKIDFMLWSNRSDRTVSILDYNKLLDELVDLKN